MSSCHPQAYAWISSAKMPSIGGNGDDLSTVLKSISQSLEEDLHTGYKAIDSAAMALTQRDDKNTVAIFCFDSSQKMHG